MLAFCMPLDHCAFAIVLEMIRPMSNRNEDKKRRVAKQEWGNEVNRKRISICMKFPNILNVISTCSTILCESIMNNNYAVRNQFGGFTFYLNCDGRGSNGRFQINSGTKYYRTKKICTMFTKM